MASPKLQIGLAGMYDKLVLLAGIVFLGVAAYVFSSAKSSASDEDAEFGRRMAALKPARKTLVMIPITLVRTIT